LNLNGSSDGRDGKGSMSQTAAKPIKTAPMLSFLRIAFGGKGPTIELTGARPAASNM
jgi:hypothetical protein